MLHGSVFGRNKKRALYRGVPVSAYPIPTERQEDHCNAAHSQKEKIDETDKNKGADVHACGTLNLGILRQKERAGV